MSRRNVTYTAPVGSIDMPAFDDSGQAYTISPCLECLPWHIEVVLNDVDSGEVMVREWHAVDCPVFKELLDS
ncbi:hypothetical protein [Gordonia malaquae]|uniref:hypothetical protein n=1 Tax=Gordonia malaquae TaxID=410332 RepID=UPI0030168473